MSRVNANSTSTAGPVFTIRTKLVVSDPLVGRFHQGLFEGFSKFKYLRSEFGRYNIVPNLCKGNKCT